MKVKWRSRPRIEAVLAFLVLGITLSTLDARGQTTGGEAVMNGNASGEVVEIRGKEVHRRAVVLEGDAFLHVLVEQRGIDVKVALVDAAGGVVWEVDSPNGDEGPEEFVAIVPDAGSYSIEITAGDSDDVAGTVVYHELARRPATDADRELVAADRTYHTLRKQVRSSPRRVIEGLEPVVELWRSRGLYRREADTLVPLCDAYLATGDAAAALAACERVIEWYRAFQAPHLLATTLRRAAAIHMSLGAPDRAVRRGEEALAISRELGDSNGVATSYQRLGAARHQLGEPQAAVDAYGEALAAVRGNSARHASIARERARILLSLRNPREALEALQGAEATYRQLDRPKRLAVTLSQQAEAYIQLEDLAKAEQTARRAFERMAEHDDLRGRAIVLKTLGSVLRHRGKLDGARRAFEHALELFTQVEDPRGQAVALTELGHVLLLQGDSEGALARHASAAELFRESRDLQGQATSGARRAQALAALGRLDEAWEHIAPALDRIETVRAETARSDFRLDYFGFRREYIGIALDILMDLHARAPEAGWDARAIAVHDRGLARELVDRVSRPRAPRAADPELAEAERTLEGRLRSLVAVDLFRPPTTARQRQIEAVLDQLHDVRGKMRQASDDASPATTPEVDVAEVRDLLGDRDLLLIYALGETRSHLWSLTNQDRRVTSLPPRDAIELWVEQFVTALQEDGDGEPARQLRDLLLTPAAERLRGRQRLIIVADGELHNMPFAALPLPGADRERRVLEEYEVVMLPSLAALLTQRRRQVPAARRPAPRRPPRKWLVIFADPVFTSDDPRLATGTDGSAPEHEDAVPAALARSLGTGRLERLRGTRDEAHSIHELLGERARVVTGLAVNREEVLEALSHHRVVHFATHGLSHPRPELSGLVLSLVDEAGHPRDGFLQTVEIARLDVAADLVVLSACETARGEEVAGEGALGLAWGFLQAGAARVVASLWKVGDAGTARLMVLFYEHLEEGRAPSAALREAQLEVAAEPGATAYDWAGFIFQGDWRQPDWPPRHGRLADEPRDGVQ